MAWLRLRQIVLRMLYARIYSNSRRNHLQMLTWPDAGNMFNVPILQNNNENGNGRDSGKGHEVLHILIRLNCVTHLHITSQTITNRNR